MAAVYKIEVTPVTYNYYLNLFYAFRVTSQYNPEEYVNSRPY
jgi:hypothetical protein